MMQHALSGVRVVDLTRVMTGPYCTMMLGDMGADVVKIEQPGKGDDTRSWGPPFLDGESAYFLSVNRNKRSITIDLKTDAGREIVWRLLEGSDVLVENFSPGTTERLGFSYAEVRARRPEMIYCSISGFGQQGPSRDRTAYDLIVQGMAGLMSVTGQPDGEPLRYGVPIADIGAGMFAAYSIVAALFHKERTGIGQYIDTSLFASQLALLTYQAGIYFATGESPPRTGNAHAIITPYQTFPTRDGYVNIACGNDAIWRRFCHAIDLAELGEDARFATNARRTRERQTLLPLLEAQLARWTRAELLARLEAAEVPGGPINSVPEALADPQVATYQLRQEVKHPTLGTVEQVGFPSRLSVTPCEMRLPPPPLGHHTDDILRELGYAADEITRLRAQQVV